MEENRFDPMTGEPIQKEVKETNEVNEVKEVVESPVAESPAAEENNFDPMTGKPIQNMGENNFDPMTGKPIQNMGENNFDPMTGKPIQNMGGYNFGSNTATPAPKKGKKIWAIAAVVAAVVLIVIIAGVSSGAFLGRSSKILLAVKNTFEEQPRFVEDMKIEDILSWLESGKYTINVKADALDTVMDVSYSASPSEIQVYGNIEGDGMPEMDFLGGLDKEQLRVQLPSVSDVVFVYDYREEADGILFEDFDEDEVELFNEALASVWDTDAQDEVSEKIQDAFLDMYKDLEIESIDSKKFEVDGKDRKCTGYALTITADDLLDFWDEVETIYEKEYESEADLMRESMRDIRQELRYMPDMDIEIYTYKNELACILVEVPDEDFEMELLFKGGDFRTQNMELSVYDYGYEETYIIEGSKDGSTEEYELSYESDNYSYDIVTIEYDHKSGNFSIENDYDEITGNIASSGNTVAITVEYENIEMMISFAKGAKLYDIKGDEFNVGTATEEDLEDISEELEDIMDDYYYGY